MFMVVSNKYNFADLYASNTYTKVVLSAQMPLNICFLNTYFTPWVFAGLIVLKLFLQFYSAYRFSNDIILAESLICSRLMSEKSSIVSARVLSGDFFKSL